MPRLTADADPFAVVLGGAEEVRRDASYHYANAGRSEADALVVQRTLAGAGFFADARGRRLVPPGAAMLFTHRESSRYGYPPEAVEDYRHRYLIFSKAAGIVAIFERVRRDFGAVVRMPAESEAGGIFDEVFTRYATRSFRDRWHEAELAHRLFTALYREQVHGTRSSDPVEFGGHFLRNHFRAPINLKTVAAQCGVTREHFIREFTRRYGEAPGLVLRRLRLEHARELLRLTERPVEEVALAAGFASANTLRRAYRAAFGRCPGEERVTG